MQCRMSSKFFRANGIDDELAVESNSLRILKTTSILVERSLLVAGAILLTVWLAVSLHGVVSSRFAIWQFETARAAVAETEHAKTAERSWRCRFQSLGREARSGLQSQPVKRCKSAARSSRDREDADSGSRI